LPKSTLNNKLLLSYAGLAVQLMVGLGLCVYIGLWVDKWIKTGIPLFAWLFPLVLIGAAMYSVIKNTGKKKKNV